jgi:hypothetical protein
MFARLHIISNVKYSQMAYLNIHHFKVSGKETSEMRRSFYRSKDVSTSIVVKFCGLVCRDQSFDEPHRLHLQDRRPITTKQLHIS